MRSTAWLTAVATLTASLLAQDTGSFELLGKYRGVGALVASTVGPGPVPGSERLYLSYLYVDNTLDLVAVDPESGAFQVFPNPAPSEGGARGITVGPDGNIYLGTLPNAHFLKLDVKAGKLLDLGRPSTTEQYIWDISTGSDGKLYGVTYPQSKLVRYDPASGKLQDLGRMDDTELYAHYVAASAGFVYAGIGTTRQDIVAYEIATGKHRSVIPVELRTVGQANVFQGAGGNVYGSAGGKHFRLQGWKATEVSESQAIPAPRDRLRDGRRISVEGQTLRVGTVERSFRYEGNAIRLFRLGFGPDRELYASAILPLHFIRYDRAAKKLIELGRLGGGEVYSFLERGDRLLMATYGGLACLMSFSTKHPFDLAAHNPRLLNFDGCDAGWRPQSMIHGHDGQVYVGAVSGYGRLGGPLTIWNPDTGSVEQFPHLIRDQSVVTLATWKDKLVGGTSVGGGGGSHPTQKEAKLFVWDPKTKKIEFETVPIPGANALDGFLTAPNGLVYGIGNGTLMGFDPASREVRFRKSVPFRNTIFNSAGIGPDGRIWGLAREGIFAIDTRTNETTLVAKAPERITAGFAIRDGGIYFISGPSVYRYRFPVP